MGRGARVDRRTLPKELRPWFECPYDVALSLGLEEKPHGKYLCAISYKCVCGTYEYPDEGDMYLNTLRIEKTND